MTKNEAEIARWAEWLGGELRRLHEQLASTEDPSQFSRFLVEVLCTHVIGYGLSAPVQLSPQKLTAIFAGELKSGVDMLADLLRAAAGDPELPS